MLAPRERGHAVSKLNGHAEYKVPYAAMEVKFQRTIDEAIAELESKISANIR